MTTVVYAHGVMVADTRVHIGPSYMDGVPKIFNTGKYLVGAVGNYYHAKPMFDWIKHIQDRHETPMSFYKDKTDSVPVEDCDSSFMVARGDDIWIIRGPLAFKIPRPSAALGSGEEYAMGALEAGADPLKALRIVIDHDSGTGGDLVWLDASSPTTDLDLGLSESQYNIVRNVTKAYPSRPNGNGDLNDVIAKATE